MNDDNVDNDNVTDQASYYERQKYIEAGMKAVDGALGALMRDKIEQVLHYDPKGIPKCLLLRYKV